MNEQIKDDIASILSAVYQVPGQYTIAAIVFFALWNSMKNDTGFAAYFLVFAFVFILLEILTLIMAGKRLGENIEKNLKRIFRKIGLCI
jgi:hypothetical protein